VTDTDVDLTVAVAEQSEAVVVRVPPSGAHDADHLVHALTAATPTPFPVVVDLRHADPGSEADMCESAREAAERLGVEWCVVSTRRRLLASGRSGPARFATARDALAALVLARQGYGPGWAHR
jgi:hypothetical protein